jgi:hypothetical protein
MIDVTTDVEGAVMAFAKLDEDPVINLRAYGPYARGFGTTSERVTVRFRRLDVISAAGGVHLDEGVEFDFEFDRSDPDAYHLQVDQPFEPDGPSRRPPSAGGYRLRLPWWMLQPLLSAPEGSSLQIEFTRTGADVYVEPSDA